MYARTIFIVKERIDDKIFLWLKHPKFFIFLSPNLDCYYKNHDRFTFEVKDA